MNSILLDGFISGMNDAGCRFIKLDGKKFILRYLKD